MARLVDVVCPGGHDHVVVLHAAPEQVSLAVSPPVVPALVRPKQPPVRPTFRSLNNSPSKLFFIKICCEHRELQRLMIGDLVSNLETVGGVVCCNVSYQADTLI